MNNFTRTKPRLLLLSDIWGKSNCEWIEYYTTILAPHFDIYYYDVCEVAGIDNITSTPEKVHSQFLSGGIDRAVKYLLAQELTACAILGFSIGGLIAWKLLLSGLPCSHLFAISSTRLRYELQKPDVKLKLFYGGLDTFIPDSSWLKQMDIQPFLYHNELHEMYRKKEIAAEICAQIIKESDQKFSFMRLPV